MYGNGQGRVRQERRSLAQSLGGLGLLPLSNSPRLVPSFTGTQSVAQRWGSAHPHLGAAENQTGRWGEGGRGVSVWTHPDPSRLSQG